MASESALQRSQQQAAPKSLIGATAGFSLIELMIALVVAGILYFVALPSYQQIMIKSNRAVGRGILLDMLSREEQFLLNHRRYALSLSDLGLPQPYFIDSTAGRAAARAAVYRVELDVVSSRFVGARAIPVNQQARDRDCQIFSLTVQGVKAVSGRWSDRPASCW